MSQSRLPLRQVHLDFHTPGSVVPIAQEFDAAAFAGAYAAMGAQRATKLLGTFTRLDRRDGKPQYLRLLPLVERRLARNLAHPLLRPLKNWFETCLPHALGEDGSASPEP